LIRFFKSSKKYNSKIKMSFRQCVNALETLTPYPELIEYIKRNDLQQESPELNKQLDAVLNEDQSHSGASWYYLLSVLRGVYKGSITHVELVDVMNNDEERCRLYRENLAQQTRYTQRRLEPEPEQQPEQEQQQPVQEKIQPRSGDDLYFQDRSRLC
jgi:hypothetical protein